MGGGGFKSAKFDFRTHFERSIALFQGWGYTLVTPWETNINLTPTDRFVCREVRVGATSREVSAHTRVGGRSRGSSPSTNRVVVLTRLRKKLNSPADKV
ncbi:hypothetical protein NPIL_563991 [Nephila pilipes]|uniref:Uncharacterized protein n=1 Tax=Nephila pilipes TaxID=299642 RepID=A0A8X6PPC6_NEPPI|nr:hypothetical protein NPIL_563991 [Nephila pilipes]